MIHVLMSLGTLPISLGSVILGALGSAVSVVAGFGGALIFAPLLFPAITASLLPVAGVGTVLSLLEEHPELVAIGALSLGLIIALFLLLRNNLNGARNGNGFGRINGNGFSNGGRNGINGKNGLKRNGNRNGAPNRQVGKANNGVGRNGSRNGKTKK